MARKPKGSHRAYKEWAPGSVKLLQQNINRIIYIKDQWPSYSHQVSSTSMASKSPLDLHRPLDCSLEHNVLRGEYVDLSLLFPDSLRL